MQLHNLKHPDDTCTFIDAVLRGIGRDNGLYFPSSWPRLDAQSLLPLSFQARSTRVLQTLIGDELAPDIIEQLVTKAFTFAPRLQPIDEQTDVLELFHGPTLAFKDFGGRFMAQLLGHLIAMGKHKGPLTILSATSGDTGAAVAHAFHRLPNVQVVILYPRGRISPLQEKMFCTLGDNIHTLAVDSDFDTCQSLVKAAFSDDELVNHYGLNSANSINMSRLFAQVCYYVEAWAMRADRDVVFSVPSGNFGNITAGLIAKRIGIPIKAFIAATNANDTVPRYLQNGAWQVNNTVATLSNAMDVSSPSNWPRAELLHQQRLRAIAVSESETVAAMKSLYAQHYLADPHTAVAYHGLQQRREANEHGIFLSTAHPAKFKEVVERELCTTIALPAELAAVVNRPLLSSTITADLALVKRAIQSAWN